MTISDLLDRWDADEPPELTALGGEEALWSAWPQIAGGPHLSLVTAVLCRDWSGIQAQAVAGARLVEALATTNRSGQFADSIDIVLTCPPILSVVAEDLATALLARAVIRVTPPDADLAGRALEAALRLELGGWTQKRLRLGAVLADVQADEDELFAARVARLLGIAYEHWQLPEFVAALERLRRAPGAEDDAGHELGMTALTDALRAETAQQALVGLHRANDLLASTGRQDSAVFQSAIAAVEAFAAGDAESTRTAANKVLRLVRERSIDYHGMADSWLMGRAAAEHEWVRFAWLLADSANGDADDMETIVGQLASAYLASRSLHLSDPSTALQGLGAIIEPVINSELVMSGAKRRALRKWLDEATFDRTDQEAAANLAGLLDGEKKKTRSSSSSPTLS